MPTKYTPVQFSSDDFPERHRDEMIRDFYGKIAMRMEVTPAEDQPVSMRATTHLLPGVAISHGTFSAVAGERTPELMSDGNDDLFLSVCASGYQVSINGQKELETKSNEAIMTSLSHQVRFVMPSTTLRTVQIRRSLLGLLHGPDDPPARALPLAHPATHLLFNYVGCIADVDLSSAELRHLVASQIADLASLALGATREATEIANLRGVRAARVQQILSEINRGYTDPALSVHEIARKLQLSPRYIQDLLHETGSGLSARIMELRLQKAHAMLAKGANLHLKVTDIAFACGFNDISYFNQSFRRRFGMTPSDVRAGMRGI